MLVSDLKWPITAIKLDWIPATTWMGFTPSKDDLLGRNRCTQTVLSQYRNGYVIEYITISLQSPNSGFERDPDYVRGRQIQEAYKGRFTAIHKLKTSSRPLEEIIGEKDFNKLQDVWAKGRKRCRWSVAFPIVESYEIKQKPLVKELLGEGLYKEFIGQTATLRAIDDRVRECLRTLEIEQIAAPNDWIDFEDEIRSASQSFINEGVQRLINRDLVGALEGQAEERKQLLRKRAAWLAEKFISQRRQTSGLKCDDCSFDPTTVLKGAVKPRSLLDVHHKNPLHEGVRKTTLDDFSLLCPTCHRVEHFRLKIGLQQTQ